MDQNLEVIMPLIMYGGDAKSSAMEAIQLAKKGELEQADDKLKAAGDSLIQAHHSQTDLLTKEASGEEISLSLLMVHAQDHLMTSMTFVDLAAEIVELYKNTLINK
ncbi:PTS lactose/cellobiose transporter subunit IIA [Streptococcus sp. X16XC17]|uniref:PTS lactose/cellobiose transporter subunit IIA n=1 Tax=unclassified Streptococcus TaxID=2608887 RepID=UPI00066FB481|nr:MULTISPECIES: PTS lactose/cellobiose transporter subunit IIA [unclassified Streptococcus]TCD46771.1 PTS lactose/cellobiose transporter subunit IIA [Streptococcus sp. X16XC17]